MKFLRIHIYEEKILLVGAYLILYGLPIGAYALLPYYRTLLDIQLPYGLSPLGILIFILLYFTLVLLIVKIPPGALYRSRAYVTLVAFTKIFKSLASGTLKPDLTSVEHTSLLLFFVKFFFTPIMLKFLLQNSLHVFSFWPSLLSGEVFTASFLLGILYPFLLSLLLLVDTGYFFVGYIVESDALGNRVRSVDATALGWLSALLCYPPFNDITQLILGWHSSDFSDFGNVTLNLLTGGMALILMGFYVSASYALGWKASNLTNRGVVSSGVYAVVRHPAYVSKNLTWWIMGMPAVLSSLTYLVPQKIGVIWIIPFDNLLLGLAPILSLMAWSGIYYIRALTEERHLSTDLEYQAYMKRVKYRFLPGIY